MLSLLDCRSVVEDISLSAPTLCHHRSCLEKAVGALCCSCHFFKYIFLQSNCSYGFESNCSTVINSCTSIQSRAPGPTSYDDRNTAFIKIGARFGIDIGVSSIWMLHRSVMGSMPCEPVSLLLMWFCVLTGLSSLGGNVAVYVFDINQPSLPTPFILLLWLFLFSWPFQLYFIP